MWKSSLGELEERVSWGPESWEAGLLEERRRVLRWLDLEEDLNILVKPKTFGICMFKSSRGLQAGDGDRRGGFYVLTHTF